MGSAGSPEAEAWIASGAAALTGRADGPPMVAPDEVVRAIRSLGETLDIDPLPLLTERAAIIGATRRGDAGCGGATRLLEASDGWVALTLARDDDVELLPAFIGVEGLEWARIATAVAERSAEELVEEATLLGLPLGRLGEVPAGANAVIATELGEAAPLARAPLVVDLSSLWAGPLCGRLLAERGAHVIKVESRTRPDGARRGPPAFFELLNVMKEQRSVDFADADAGALRELLLQADVVIEGSRPRALEQLGIDAAETVRAGPQVWVSITGHGRGPAERDRVAFGDDAAVAGGLVADDERGPVFVADAVADPLTGVAAAAAVVGALALGGRWLLDVALSRTAATVVRPGLPWAVVQT